MQVFIELAFECMQRKKNLKKFERKMFYLTPRLKTFSPNLTLSNKKRERERERE